MKPDFMIKEENFKFLRIDQLSICVLCIVGLIDVSKIIL